MRRVALVIASAQMRSMTLIDGKSMDWLRRCCTRAACTAVNESENYDYQADNF